MAGFTQTIAEFGESTERKIILTLWITSVSTISTPFWFYVSGNLLLTSLLIGVLLIAFPQPVVIFWHQSRKGVLQLISCVWLGTDIWPIPTDIVTLDVSNPLKLALTLKTIGRVSTITLLFKYPEGVAMRLADTRRGIDSKTSSGAFQVKMKIARGAKLGLLFIIKLMDASIPSQFNLTVKYKIGRRRQEVLCVLPVGVTS